tara:strand:- start:216 stop:740 length:525 start_codon:yes stop_codon:yes gene_type:complete
MKLKKYFFKKVKSTNNTALRLLKNGKLNGAIISEAQSKGRGQRGNKWISKKGNLFMTVFFEISNKLTLKKITQLNLSIIKRIILKITKTYAYVKLPNDILINKKKICGILQEIAFVNSRKFIIIGIGINIVNSPNLINYPTTYINNYSKKKYNKIKLFKQIKLNFEKEIKHFKI